MYWIMTEHGWRPWYPSVVVCTNQNKLEGVLMETTLEQAQKETNAHADHYVETINKFLNGEFKGTGHERWLSAKSRLDQFRLLGGFGEKL